MTTSSSALRHIQRRPRFVRRESKTNLVVTERDTEIFKTLVLDRFMSASDIARLIQPDADRCLDCAGKGVIHDPALGRDVHHRLCLGTGRQGHKKLIQRIGDLWASGHLDRPPLQYDYWRPGGSRRLVYGLGNDGARALMRIGALPHQANVDWSSRSQSASKKFLHHSLAISDLSVALQLAVRRRPLLSLLQSRALAATLPEESAKSDYPFKLRARIDMDGKSVDGAVIPDRAFMLRIPSRDARKAADSLGYLAELDRGTEPISRSTPTQTSVIKKLLTYELAHRAGEVARRLDWAFFRVPIITTTTERVDNIIAAINANRILKTSRLFMLTTLDAVRAAEDVLTIEWRRPSGKTAMLIPERIVQT